jgi:hypothetical protein
LACAQIAAWYFFYRFDDRSARIATGCAGLALVLIVVVQLLRISVGFEVSEQGVALITYFAVSHRGYAAFARDGS